MTDTKDECNEIVSWQLDSLKKWMDNINADLMADDFFEVREKCQNDALRLFSNNKEFDTPENRAYFKLK